jgi:hypothetical protein
VEEDRRKAEALNVGIFSCDPGGATGLAWGVFDPNVEIGESLRGRMKAGSATIEGDIRSQIREISGKWQEFYKECVQVGLLPHDKVWYVCENFIYSGGSYQGESAMISTALIWGVEGYRMGRADQWAAGHGRRKIVVPQVVLQNPGDASAFAKDARLREWGLWIRGKQHERSAWRHLALFLKKYQIQYAQPRTRVRAGARSSA